MIVLHGVEKSYGPRAVLRGVDLHVHAGERVALVGPNGSGKTTLLRAILGLVRVSGGVRVAGFDPWEDHAAAQERVAWVPQRAPALPARVGDLAAAWSRMRGRPVARLVEVAGAFGLDVAGLRGVRFDWLSGGMQQKLLAAMALATDCPLLCFDEPTANLDPHARDVFIRRLDQKRVDPAGAPAVLLSSHRMDEVRHLVDRIVVLDDGRVRADATLGSVLADPVLAEAAGLTPHVPEAG
ncbi:MAG: ABC transporter ATP-binding protein [Pseudomonadota bacterium]|nr:ABC transporter ATP-binding protein [Pseudomonadota bacterium]